MKHLKLALGACCAVAILGTCDAADDLSRGFQKPPPGARPWVYWFPLDGNISSNGITLDLEAMRRAGIGGVLYMETDQGAPRGPAKFAGPLWRDLFKHICAEAKRLGLQVNMNNDAGWCGSGGPWITPELSMQRVVWTETNITGPMRLQAVLPQAPATANYYRDIAVFAFPTPANKLALAHLRGKSANTKEEIPLRANYTEPPADSVVPRGRIVNLTGQMDASGGRLTWDVPEGKWTILRLGHTSTGKDNHPAPIDGRGLECDKLSKEAAEVMFAGLMGKLIADNRSFIGERRTLVSTHIDSWEVGSQNWTPKFRQEFQRLRGYDPLPLLPVMAGRVVDSLEVSERFLWDVRMTVNELLLENYAGHFRTMAHRHGMRLSIEAYDGVPADDMAYAGRADEPMGEFWSYAAYSGSQWCTEMASAAHVYGRPVLGAEAFTATDAEKWQGHPGSIKAMGDWAFCEGINRFVFHRYALQPWTDVRPGMSMGPWGLHYERTQTWWEQSRAWHEYLARCQFLLQQGLFVADLCFLAPEMSPQRFKSPVKSGLDRPGYNFDGCPPEALLTRMKVKDGRLVLPDGMSYRLLVLPQVPVMTPALLRKVKELVADGATVVGAPPLKSPSLSGYPACDDEVKRLSAELWGEAGTSVAADAPAQGGAAHRTRAFGKGQVIWGGGFQPFQAGAAEDQNLLRSAKWIWFKEGNPAVAAPPGKRYFRRLLPVDAAARIQSAQLIMTADNGFECRINGQLAGSGDNFGRTYTMSVGPLLRPGANLLSVVAVNTTENPNPAGLIGLLRVRFRDGRTLEFPTDSTWEAAQTASGAWTTDAAAGNSWAPALELGPLGMDPWGDVEQAIAAADPVPDINVLCRLLKGMGVPPDFACQTQSPSRGFRYIHKRIGKTDCYFVASKSTEAVEAVCSFRVQGRRPEFWWPDSGRIERAAVYEQAGECIRVPIRLEPSGSVFVLFREAALSDRDPVAAVTRDGQPAINVEWKDRQEPRADNNAGVTNRFTLAAWVRPAADTTLPPESATGMAAFGVVRNDALFPPPGHEVYSDSDQAGCGFAVGRNGVTVFEHAADYFAPVLVFPRALTNWTHLALVYRDGQPSLYLDGRLVHQGMRSRWVVHPGAGVSHGRGVAPFKGDLGAIQQFDRALSGPEVEQLARTMPRPAGRTQMDALTLTRDSRGHLEAECTQPGAYVLKTAAGRTHEFKADALPAPLGVAGPWEVAFDPKWGGPVGPVTFDKLEDWSKRPEAGIRYYSGTALYRTRFTWSTNSKLETRNAKLYLDLGRVAVMADVKLNGKDLGVLWKAPFRVDVTGALKPGENRLELKVVNLWINRQIGDEQLPEDSERNPEGTLKRWPQWLQEGKPSPAGRYTFTSWRLWKKNDPLAESGLLGPVTVQTTSKISVN